MPHAKYSFPKTFLWGTATAGYQVEGGNQNTNWTAWENTPGKIVSGDKCGKACDWWGGRWKEDLSNAARDGQNAHRFGIEWSRIQPKPDYWDENSLAYYREILRGMKQMGLATMLTLHHYTDPIWVVEQGGWQNEKTAELFAVFTRKVVNALGDLVDYWITVNEPFGYMASAYIQCTFPPGEPDLKKAFIGLTNLIQAHANAYHVIHEILPNAKVGFTQYYLSLVPARLWFPPDFWVTKMLDQAINCSFADALVDGKVHVLMWKKLLPTAIHTMDFFGLNYYTRNVVTFDITKPKELFYRFSMPENAQLSENKFIAHIPEAILSAIQWARRYHLPIYITENGIEDSKDSLRPRFIIENLRQVWKAVNFNWNVKGYFHWSQVDNFEWERGWSQRFGLWGLNVETQERIRRKSGDVYASICKENGITSEMVEKYVPEILSTIFPGF